MTAFAVYEPPREAPGLLERADNLAFVKDGFSWPALFVPLLWLIYHRMWIELVVLLAVSLGLQWAFGTDPQGQTLAAWASLAVGVLFAFEANDLRSSALERRGYRLAGVASGRDRTEAERAFFTAWLPQQHAKPEKLAERGHEKLSEAAVSHARSEGEEVIGLFPRP